MRPESAGIESVLPATGLSVDGLGWAGRAAGGAARGVGDALSQMSTGSLGKSRQTPMTPVALL